jgi:hypothetical protein
VEITRALAPTSERNFLAQSRIYFPMTRAKIKIPLLLIAVTSTAYWFPQGQPQGQAMALGFASLLWSLLGLAAFRWDRAEDWNYRLSSFLGMALATVEGMASMVALPSRQGLAAMACLHLTAFLLSVAGRYQKVKARRPSRGL